MNHKTKSFIAVLLALCLMLSLGVGALADRNVVDSTPGNIPSVTFGDSNTLTNTDPSTDQGADDKENDEPPTDPEGPFNFQSQDASGGGAGSSGGTGDSGDNPVKYSVTVNPGAGATITSLSYYATGGDTQTLTNGGYVDNGTSIVLKVDVQPGYTFGGFDAKNSSGEDYSIGEKTEGQTYFLKVQYTNVTIDVNTTANINSIDVTLPDDGTIAVTDSATSAATGSTVNFTVTPSEGYEIDNVSVLGPNNIPVTVFSNNGSYSFVMPAGDVIISATFTEETPEPPATQTYSVTSNTGHFSISGLQGSYAAGAEVSFTVTPEQGYYINSVSATGATVSGGNGSYYFTMPAGNVAITVDVRWNGWWPGYDHWHSIDASYDGDYGYVTVDSWAYVGDTVYFTVHPYYDSWHYWDYSVGVYTDGGVKLDVGHYAGDTWYFTMPNDDVTVYAWFDWYHGDYSVSKSVEGDGSIYVRSWADHGDKVWIDAVPQSGASLTSLNVYYNGGSWWYESLHGYYGRWYEVDVHYDSARGEYYFYMPAHDVVVEAVFTTVGESITVVKPDNGSLKLSTLRAEKGDLVYITVDPDKGYELSGLEVLSSLGKNVEVTELSENYYVFRMPGLNVKVKAEFRLSAYTPFADVSPNAWYFEAVSFVYDKGLMEGTSNYAFSPDADLSRGMLAAILYRMAGSPEVSGYSTFGDVPTTAYYARAIAWAQDHGIVTGVSAESYKPDSPVTREQLVAILSRYAQYKGYETSVSYDYLSTYGDASSASAYAREALNWAVARGVIDGQSGGVLAPTATASRAEVAQVLMNYLAVYA